MASSAALANVMPAATVKERVVKFRKISLRWGR